MTRKQSYRPSLTLDNLDYLVDLLAAQVPSPDRDSCFTKLLSATHKAKAGLITPSYTASDRRPSPFEKAGMLLDSIGGNTASPLVTTQALAKETLWKQSWTNYIMYINEPSKVIPPTPECLDYAAEHMYLNDLFTTSDLAIFESGNNPLVAHVATLTGTINNPSE